MRRMYIIDSVLLTAALMVSLPVLGRAYDEFLTPTGGTVSGSVALTTNAAGQAVPISPSSPMATSAGLFVGATLPNFSVTTADQALTGLTLPGRVTLCNPQQAFGVGTTNTVYVNVNWTGGSSLSDPGEQIAPGVCEVSVYATVAPHVSVNSGSSPVTIGVMQ